MGKSKYEGGARITTFRLPKLNFEEAKKGIEKYLERFENNKSIFDNSNSTTAFWDGKIEVTNTKGKRLKIEKQVDSEFMEKALKMVAVEPEKLVIDMPNKKVGGTINPTAKLHIKKAKGIPDGFNYGIDNMDNENSVKLNMNKLDISKSVLESTGTGKIPLFDDVFNEKVDKALADKAKIEKAVERDGNIYYPCGCYRGPDKFHRIGRCKIGYTAAHEEKYGL